MANTKSKAKEKPKETKPKTKKSKYHVDISEQGKKDRTYNGIKYDSLSELQFLKEFIEPRVAKGYIKEWDRQKSYVLQEGFTNHLGKKILPVKYKSDFNIWFADAKYNPYCNSDYVVVDVKGHADNLSLLKRKLMWSVHPDENLTFVARSLKFGEESSSYWIEYDILQKMRKDANKIVKVEKEKTRCKKK